MMNSQEVLLQEENLKEKKGLTGSSLKLIAIVTMLIDHMAAGLLMRYINAGPEYVIFWKVLYSIMRCIGRIAFPIFCFMLIEGFFHTRSVTKYARRLGLFCILSEVPFDYCFFGKFYMGYQNVFFTLLIGLLTIAVIEQIKKRELSKPVTVTLTIIAAIAGMVLAELLHTDYSANGIFCIVILYLFHANRATQILAGILAFLFEAPFAQIGFIPIHFYNGKRGLHIKYLYYFFYPVHLAIIYAVVCLCHLQAYPAM